MKKINQGLVLAVITIGIFIRMTAYDDLRLSVANADTPTYVKSSEVNLLSWEAFRTYRPFTTNMVYKIFTPGNGYRYRAISEGEAGTVKRKIDRGFDDIAVLQSTISIIAWACLAWIFTSQLQNSVIRVASAGIIMLFGFTPQIADWDSVLGAESLSISLFVIAFAILLWLSFAFYNQPELTTNKMAGFALLYVVLFFWIFVRDVNAYSLLILVVLLLGLYIFPRFRKAKFLLLASLVVLALFIVGEISARQRPLWKLALEHVWGSDILPFPANVRYFSERGMPEYGTPEYSQWFNERARSTYLQFLLVHPAYTTFKFFRDVDVAFAINLQPYFKASELPARPLLIMAGNYLHSKSGTVFFIIIFLLLILWSFVLFQNKRNVIPWAWIITWAFLTATATIFFTIFGDTYGLVRHTLSSTMTFRLLMWMLLLIIADIAWLRVEKQAHLAAPSLAQDGSGACTGERSAE